MNAAKLLAVLLFAIAGLSDRLLAQTNVPAGPPMSRVNQEKAAYPAVILSRLLQLEKLGEVPEKADSMDWQLAQQTTWWGKRLYPKAFWKGRVLWLDKSADFAARSYGRRYPPVPCDDPSLPSYKDGDVDVRSEVGVEGPNVHYYGSSLEGVFWDRFSKTHPRPPEEIEREQLTMEQLVSSAEHEMESKGNIGGLSSNQLREIERSFKQPPRDMGYPKEAFTDDALRWSYIMNARQDYQNFVSTYHTTNALSIQSLIEQLGTDARYLTEPSDADVLKSANAWKIAYLQRLSKEKVDQSYINAYLKAWNLKPEEVFTNTTIAVQPIR